MPSKRQRQRNIFEINNDIDQEDFFHFMMDKSEEIDEFDRRLLHMDLHARNLSASEVDTYDCDCIFIRVFPTSEMIIDFPEIAHDFFLHAFQKVKQYDQVEYLPDHALFDHPTSAYINWTLNLMLNAAKQGDPYTIGLFQHLFQTYYKREYKQLKRFRYITRGELNSIARLDEDVMGMSRLAICITMCRIMGIQLDPDCNIIYMLQTDFMKGLRKAEERPFFEGFSHEIIDKAVTRIEHELDELEFQTPEKRKIILKEFKNYNRIVSVAEKCLSLPEGFVEDADTDLFDFEELLIRTLEFMLYLEPDKDHSFDEILRNAVLVKVMTAFGIYHSLAEENLKRILGLDYDLFEVNRNHSLFKPEKVKIPSTVQSARGSGIKKAEPETRSGKMPTAEAATDSQELLYEELEKLRAKLKKQEQENKALRQENRDLDQKLKETESVLENLKGEHQELVHLRNHVYQMTEKEQEVPTIDLQTMENALKPKKIIIIGGHSNWTSKLKNKFSKWVFLKPEINNTLDGKVLEDADYIYFFTDTMSHGTYGKYMKIIRTKRISCYGYIHSINISFNIKQIYEDLMKLNDH
ncbi:MAG: hypothetical protein Q4B85_13580 [Lachnospiraceae bacterium]|nr:hypothetical protein [Lachnospiraceae bacterium]